MSAPASLILARKNRARIVGLHGLLVASAAAWCIALAAAPVFGSGLLYTFFSAVCHQLPERSWFLAGQPLAVCVRCAAIYGGFLAGLILRTPPNTHFLRLAILALGLEFVTARLGFDFAVARALTGFALGSSAAGFIQQGIRELVARHRPAVRACAR